MFYKFQAIFSSQINLFSMPSSFLPKSWLHVTLQKCTMHHTSRFWLVEVPNGYFCCSLPFKINLDQIKAKCHGPLKTNIHFTPTTNIKVILDLFLVNYGLDCHCTHVLISQLQCQMFANIMSIGFLINYHLHNDYMANTNNNTLKHKSSHFLKIVCLFWTH